MAFEGPTDDRLAIRELGATYVDGDQARGHTYTSELVKYLQDKRARWTGLYQDEYVKRDGVWLFKSRTFKILDVGVA